MIKQNVPQVARGVHPVQIDSFFFATGPDIKLLSAEWLLCVVSEFFASRLTVPKDFWSRPLRTRVVLHRNPGAAFLARGLDHRTAAFRFAGLCCTNLMRDSSRESSVVDGGMSRPTPPADKTRSWLAYNEALKRRGSPFDLVRSRHDLGGCPDRETRPTARLQ